MTFSGLEILLIITIIIVLLLLPLFIKIGWFGIITKIISFTLFSIIIGITIYIAYQYYSTEDIPLDKIEAQQILNSQKEIYTKKSYEDLLKILSSKNNEPDTFEVIGDSNVTYQIEVSTCWIDDENKEEGLLVNFTIDNGYRSAYSPMLDSFVIKK